MPLHSLPAAARSVSPATWCALTVLVLVLGALGLLLIGCSFVPSAVSTDCIPGQVLSKAGDICVGKAANYYTCECTCTPPTPPFGINVRVQGKSDGTTTDVVVRDAPGGAGNIITHVPFGSFGTIVNGPQQADLNGTTYTWWEVVWDTGTTGTPPNDGWTREPLLSVVGPMQLVQDINACLPAALNANDGGTAPTDAQVAQDCTNRVGAAFQADGIALGPLPPRSQCTCGVTAQPTKYANECDVPCGALDGVCTVTSKDPAQPTPDSVADALFASTTVCQVSGQATTFSVGGHSPKSLPNVQGFVQIHGKPCQGQGCQVGLSYQLTSDNIEFDSGTVFASDPKFVDLIMSGATAPNGVNLGQLLGGFIGDVTAFGSARGRRSNSNKAIAVAGGNTQALAFAVVWDSSVKACRLAGNALTGTVKGDNNETLNVSIDIALDGVLLDQPPVANAGRDQTVECTSPAGAQVTLNASGSTDADANIAYYIWRRDSDTGPLVGDPSASPVRKRTQAIGTTTYNVRVVDADFAADEASVNVKVTDTTPPTIACNAPATMTPPVIPISFRATATDICSAPPPVVIDNVACFDQKPNGDLVPWQGCGVTVQGDTITIGDTGANKLIRWLTHATDPAGNVGRRTCEVSVVPLGTGK